MTFAELNSAIMKVKKILSNTTNRHEYNMAHLFELDVWNRREMNALRHKHYGGYDKNLRHPNWKMQKIQKQWMVKKFKVTTWVNPCTKKMYTTIKV